ncbi:MAG: TonB-dependent receptor plug domain-containing protein [Candidatus Saccharicenans sp.]
MKKYFSALFLFMFLSFFLSGLQAANQDKPTKIHHEIVVTATRLETPVKETASAITILKTEELSPFRNLQPEALFSQSPGAFYAQAGPTGGTGSLFIRGANSEHTLFMIDGLEINDPISPARSYNFNLFNLNLIDRIEILRGPQSTLYGSDALAGVVNLVTNDPEKKEAELFGSFGSLRTWQGNFKLAENFGRLAFQLQAGLFNTRGVSAASQNLPGNTEPDGFGQQSLAFKIKYRFSDNIFFSWQTRALQARADLDSFGGPYGDDPNYTQKTRFLFNRAEINYFLLNHRWEQKLILGLEKSRRDNCNEPDDLHPGESEIAFYRSTFFKLDWQNNFYISSQQTAVFGFEYKKEAGQSDDTYTSPYGIYNSNFPEKAAQLTAIYFQDIWKPVNRLSLISGLRLDHHQQFGQALTYRLAANLEFPEIEAQIRATLGTGFKAPSLYQLYAPQSIYGPIGNSDLKAEKNLGWDVGFEKKFSNWISFSLGYFQTRYHNLIEFYFGSGYANVGQVLTRGIEASLNFHLLPGIDGRLGWTQLKALNLDDRSELLRRPRGSGFLSLGYKKSQGIITAEINYLGPRKDLDYCSVPPSLVTLHQAFLSSVYFAYEVSPKAEFLIHVANIFNTKYELIYGYGMPGSTISAGFRLKLF